MHRTFFQIISNDEVVNWKRFIPVLRGGFVSSRLYSISLSLCSPESYKRRTAVGSPCIKWYALKWKRLTHESIVYLHCRNGLDDRLFEKVAAFDNLMECGLCAVFYCEVEQEWIGKPS